MGKHLFQMSCRHEKRFCCIPSTQFLGCIPWFWSPSAFSHFHVGRVGESDLVGFYNPIFQSETVVVQGGRQRQHRLIHHHLLLLLRRLPRLCVNFHGCSCYCFCYFGRILWSIRNLDLDSRSKWLRKILFLLWCRSVAISFPVGSPKHFYNFSRLLKIGATLVEVMWEWWHTIYCDSGTSEIAFHFYGEPKGTSSSELDHKLTKFT